MIRPTPVLEDVMPRSKKKLESECNVPNCTARVFKLGVCKTHSEQNYAVECTVEGCDREVFAKGRCKPHYMRHYRKKRGEAAPKADKPIRDYGQPRFEVFTRIPLEDAEAILEASGRDDGMYEKAGEILSAWAKKHRAQQPAHV